VKNVWAIPELFVMPTPLMVSVNPGVAVMVKALAPALNTIPFTSVLAARERNRVFDVAKVAVSAEPLGTVAGVQLLALFQLLVGGLDCHTELPATARLVGRRMQAAKIQER